MYVYNIVVKWPNGDLEGFGASALDEKAALERAVRKAGDKQREFRIPGIFQVLSGEEFRALDIDAQDKIQVDWDASQL